MRAHELTVKLLLFNAIIGTARYHAMYPACFRRTQRAQRRMLLSTDGLEKCEGGYERQRSLPSLPVL